MDILNEFGIKKNEKNIISLVGAGGKSSTMYRLAETMKSHGKKVLVTTTTAIFYPGRKQYDLISVSMDKEEAFKVLEKVTEGTITIIGSEAIAGNKLKGIPREWIKEILDRDVFDYILVEADGSKRRPIKAPADHEPVLPNCTDILIGVIGMDSYGQKINEEIAHRSELLAKLTDKEIDGIIDSDVILKLIKNKEGLFKNAPKGCKRVLFLNKVKSEEELEIGIYLGDRILSEARDIDRVIMGAIKESPQIRKVLKNNSIAGIIMASGFSRRMGRDKLLLEIENKLVIEEIINIVANYDFHERVLVYRDSKVEDIGKNCDIKTVFNHKAEGGMSEAMKLGIVNTSDVIDGYMFFNGDQPLLTLNTVKMLIQAFNEDNGTIIVPRYNGKPGTPVLFHRRWREGLLKVTGDKGGRDIIKNNPKDVYLIDIADPKEGMDLDTWEDYKNIMNQRDGSSDSF